MAGLPRSHHARPHTKFPTGPSRRVKILVYDGTGLVLYSKRLEAGRFCWPSPADGVVRLSAAQLSTLLEGLAWNKLQPRPVRRPVAAW